MGRGQAQMAQAAEIRRKTVDPDKLNRSLKRQFKKELNQRLDNARRAVERAAREVEYLKSKDNLDNLLVRVSIWSVYEQLGEESVKVTERGLARAIESAEREFVRRNGSLRTDGV